MLYFAPRNIGWMAIKEGTGAIAVYGKKFYKQFANYEGYFLDTDGCVKIIAPGVITSQKSNWERFKNFVFCRVIGGTIWYGWWPIYQRLTYHQVWKVFRETEEQKMKKYDKDLDYVFLPRDFYIFEYSRKPDEAIEDINRVPIVGVTIIIPIRVYNPRVAVYSTKIWLESIGATIWPIFENFVPFFRWDDDLLGMRVGKNIADLHLAVNKIFHKPVQEGDNLIDLLWDDLKNSVRTDTTFIENIPGETDECFSVFGVIVYKNGFRVYKIDPDKKYRDAAAAKRLEEQEGDAKIKKTEKDGEAKVIAATKRALAMAEEGKGVQNNLLARTVGYAIKSLCEKYGLSEDNVREKLLSGELKEDFEKFLEEGRRREAMDSDQYNEQVYPKEATVENLIRMAVERKR